MFIKDVILWNLTLFSWAPIRNFLWCYYRSLIISLALENFKKECNMLYVILVQDVCPLKIKITQCPGEFRFNNPSTFHLFSPAWKLWQIKDYSKTSFPGSSPENEAGWFKFSWVFLQKGLFSFLCISRRERLMRSILISRAPQYTMQICLFIAFSRLALYFRSNIFTRSHTPPGL